MALGGAHSLGKAARVVWDFGRGGVKPDLAAGVATSLRRVASACRGGLPLARFCVLAASRVLPASAPTRVRPRRAAQAPGRGRLGRFRWRSPRLRFSDEGAMPGPEDYRLECRWREGGCGGGAPYRAYCR